MDNQDSANAEWEQAPFDEAAEAQELRRALMRVEAPEGFTDGVMARLQERNAVRPAAARESGRGLLLRFPRPAWRAALAVAAVLTITAGAVRVEYARVQRQREARAVAQLDRALQVTNHALDQVSAKLETTAVGQVQRALEENTGGDQ